MDTGVGACFAQEATARWGLMCEQCSRIAPGCAQSKAAGDGAPAAFEISGPFVQKGRGSIGFERIAGDAGQDRAGHARIDIFAVDDRRVTAIENRGVVFHET